MLSQQLFDEAAGYIRSQMGEGIIEPPFTYVHQATQNAAEVSHAIVDGRFLAFTQLEFGRDETIQAFDERLRIPTPTVRGLGFKPSKWDRVTRNDGTKWAVINSRWGEGYPFYDLQMRQVG